MIDYLTFKNPDFVIYLKDIIDRVILDEFTVDWDAVHYIMTGL